MAKLNKTKTPTYVSWLSMKCRCLNKNSTMYYRYGAKGITVCTRWRYSFKNFLEDMGERPSLRHSIDRIDGRGNYEPGNCRWSTSIEQNNNRSSNRNITAFGETKTAAYWSRDARCVVSHDTLRERIRNGWEAEQAIQTKNIPINKRSAIGAKLSEKKAQDIRHRHSCGEKPESLAIEYGVTKKHVLAILRKIRWVDAG